MSSFMSFILGLKPRETKHSTRTNESAVPDVIDFIVVVNAATAGGTHLTITAVEVAFIVRNGWKCQRASVVVAAPTSGSSIAINLTHVVDHYVDVNPGNSRMITSHTQLLRSDSGLGHQSRICG